MIGNQVLESAVIGIEVEASGVKGESDANNNAIEDNQVYFAGQFGIEILGSSNTTVEGNTVYEASQSSSDDYAGIEVSSDGTFAPAQNNQVINNTSYGSGTQRNGLQIDSGIPKPSQTVVNENSLGIGVSGMSFYNGGSKTMIGSNVLDYTNPNPPQE